MRLPSVDTTASCVCARGEPKLSRPYCVRALHFATTFGLHACGQPVRSTTWMAVLSKGSSSVNDCTPSTRRGSVGSRHNEIVWVSFPALAVADLYSKRATSFGCRQF